MYDAVANVIHNAVDAACEDYHAVVSNAPLNEWRASVHKRLVRLRKGDIRPCEIAPLTHAIRRTKHRQLQCSADVYDIETFKARNAANVSRLSAYVAEQKDVATAEIAEALENEARASLMTFFVNALQHFKAVREELCDQKENTQVSSINDLTDWQRCLLEDWRALLMRHCGAFGTSPPPPAAPASPLLPPPNPNFTIWSSPNHLSPLSQATPSVGGETPLDSREYLLPPPPPPMVQPQPPVPLPEAKKRRLTLNLDISKIHSQSAAFDAIMGGAGTRAPKFGSDLPSFRPELPPAAPPTDTTDWGAQLQNPTGEHKPASRQRSPQEAEHLPYRSFNFGLPSIHPPPQAPIQTQTAAPPAFNPQADLSSQLTFRPPGRSPMKGADPNRPKPPDARALQKKKRLSLTAKAAMAQEGANLPQWWD